MTTGVTLLFRHKVLFMTISVLYMTVPVCHTSPNFCSAIGELEYDEVIEEYEEEIFAQEEAQEPIGADPADPTPAQGKPSA